MQLVNMSPESDLTNHHYYLPHHAVFKQDSFTTKIRVVFDGSAKSSNALSLNDNLEAGPVIQDELFNILIRFRCSKYVISADITKMYRQILINNKDKQFQKNLWRDNPQFEMNTYELATLTYGTKSAPYLAIRCLQQ